MDISDPWDWSIDRVVQELCTADRIWQPRSGSAIIPEPAQLEKVLRKNEVSGSVLLVDVDDAVLKEDLGIKVLGRRAFVKHAISELRLKSVQYQTYMLRYQPHSIVPSAINRNMHGIYQHYSLHPSAPSIQAGQPIPSVHEPGNCVSLDSTNRQPSVLSLPTNLFGVNAAAEVTANTEYVISQEAQNKRRKIEGMKDVSGHDPSNEVNDNGVVEFENSQNGILTPAPEPVVELTPGGKKQKRIAPTLITSEVDPRRIRELATEADSVIRHGPQNIEPGVPFVDASGQKRLVPIRQAIERDKEPYRYNDLKRLNTNELSRAPSSNSKSTVGKITKTISRRKKTLSTIESPASGYLGTRKMQVDNIFYEGIDPGQEILAADQGKELCQVSSNISTGRRLYVHGIMKHFFRSETQPILRGGKSLYAIRPYSDKLAQRFQKQSFTLYYSSPDGIIHARREDVSSWPELNTAYVPKTQASGDEHSATFNPLGPGMIHGLGSSEDWDPSFLEKYKHLEGGDEILPLYGESDEENEYDLSTWKEIEEERGSQLERPLKPRARQRLSLDDIHDAINEGISEIVIKWTEKILPRRQRQEWSLWTKSRKRNSKRAQIIAAQRDLDNILKRISKLRKEIATEEWTNKNQVKKQTRIMETNIFAQEDMHWKISALEQKRQPEKPPLAGPKKSKAHSEDGEDGESIETDSEASSIDDDLDAFIVQDGPAVSEDEQERFLADFEDGNDEATSSDASSSGAAQATLPATPSKSRSANPRKPSANVPHDEPRSQVHAFQRRASPQVKDEEMTLPQPPKASPSGMVEMIDLTILSSDSGPEVFDLVTPRKRKKPLASPVRQKSPLSGSPIPVSDEDDNHMPDVNDLPPYGNPSAVAKFSNKAWSELLDGHRLVIKALYSMIDELRTAIFSFVSTVSSDELWTNMHQLVDAHLQGEDTVKGMDVETADLMRKIIRLFQMFITGKPQPSYPSIPRKLLHESISEGHDQRFNDFYQFCRKLEGYFRGEEFLDEEDSEEGLQTAGKRRAKNLTEDDLSENQTPHKKRKKKIFEDSHARDLREHDRQRLAEQEERRKRLQANLIRAGHASDEERGRIIINDAKTDDQGLVFVNEHIAQRIKPHQIDGVRFLWDQIVANNKVMQGCLLAHTMGLGKTMQVITLLVAIAESAASSDLSISSQVPESLRGSRTLILCPPTLIDNWMDELLTWSPKDLLGNFRKIDSSSKLGDRLQTISSWYLEGGILILGYEMFRILIANKQTAKRGSPLDQGRHDQVCKELLEGPRIVIADEAHKMKNANAGVTLAASRFKTGSRVALTGSPLANNVEEYHTMIEWVAPNYLGPILEFRAKYVEPIQAGSWHDSTGYERRKSLKMLGVLQEDLAPKVHRADMSVLRNDLPQKQEFVITVALTELQRKAYSLYVKSMVFGASRTKDGEVTQTTVWHWLAILALLCNHPACFNAKMTERKEAARKEKSFLEDLPSSRDATDVEAPGGIAAAINEPVWKVGVSQQLIDDETRLFKEEAPDMKAIELSNKVKILCQILDAAKVAEDKTLVFSQSIPTLDFLEELCLRQGRKHARLDGATKMNKRQSLTKAFNNGDLDLYLISTAAGGLGLNLPGANRVVIFDFKFNPIMEEQAVGRAYRIGQKKPTFVYRFIAGGTFEDSVHNKTIFKMQLASRVVDKKNPVAWAKKRLGDFLFEPKDVEAKDLSEFEGMDVKVLDKILQLQGKGNTIRAIVQSDTFERDDDDKLTAEEEKEVKQLLGDEQLKRSDPRKWQEIQQKRNQAAYAQQIRASQGSGMRAPLVTVTPGYSQAAVFVPVRTPILPPAPAWRMSTSGLFTPNNGRPAPSPVQPPFVVPQNPLPTAWMKDGQSSTTLVAATLSNHVNSSASDTTAESAKTIPVVSPEILPRLSPISVSNIKAQSTTIFQSPSASPASELGSLPAESSALGIDGADSSRDLDHVPPRRKKPGKIESALAEATKIIYESPTNKEFQKAAEISFDIKIAAKKRARETDAVTSILEAAATYLNAHVDTCHALMNAQTTADSFVRDIIRSIPPSSTDDITKTSIFRAMNKQPVKSLRTPVTKPIKQPSRRNTFADEDARVLKSVEEKRLRRLNSTRSPQKPVPERPLPGGAKEDINEAKSRGDGPRRHTLASYHAELAAEHYKYKKSRGSQFSSTTRPPS